uniref:Metalloendopeptidase n=1 Tax=Spodoptera frugiperda TaxID=7108 RepID=A0A2H1WVL0_SPOFR
MNLFLCFYSLIITICYVAALALDTPMENWLDSEVTEDKSRRFNPTKKPKTTRSWLLSSEEKKPDPIDNSGSGSIEKGEIQTLNKKLDRLPTNQVEASGQIQEASEADVPKAPGSSQSSIELKPAIFVWTKGIVPYFIDPKSYDEAITKRIRTAMNSIERVSCVIFKPLEGRAAEFSGFTWLSIENPTKIRRCIHRVLHDGSGKATMILGYECMQPRDILHAMMHVLGFHDEITHPQRDSYVRVIWPNIQPQYRSLFWVRGDFEHKDMVEYDTMSIMHFHDHAFSSNGGPTIVPLVSKTRKYNYHVVMETVEKN